jgi:hypothetical protein
MHVTLVINNFSVSYSFGPVGSVIALAYALHVLILASIFIITQYNMFLFCNDLMCPISDGLDNFFLHAALMPVTYNPI